MSAVRAGQPWVQRGLTRPRPPQGFDFAHGPAQMLFKDDVLWNEGHCITGFVLSPGLFAPLSGLKLGRLGLGIFRLLCAARSAQITF